MNAEPTESSHLLRCPTCGAQQEWADVCRRCKTDLSLVVGLLRSRQSLRATCLQQLREGQITATWRTALRCCAVSRDQETLRLLAVTAMLNGRWQSALEIIEKKG